MDDAAPLDLPDDVTALKALCAELLAARDVLGTRLAERDARLAERDVRLAERDARLVEREAALATLMTKYVALRRWIYGPRADRLTSVEGLGQLLLSFGAELEARPVDPVGLPKDDATGTADQRHVGATQDGKSAKRKAPLGRRRIADLDHLPLHECKHDLSDEQKACPCCGERRKHMGIKESWQVEYVPGHFERYHHVRHTYSCQACDAEGLGGQVETAAKSRATAPVEKGMAGPGLLAYVVTSKYADYLPLYRLENVFGRNGLDIARSTLCVWCRDAAEIAMPLYRVMCDRVRASRVVATDDTIMPMQAKDRTKKARIWIYSGDHRNPYNVFDFTPSRSRDGPSEFLAGFEGTLLADGYGGYDGVVAGNGITRAGCWAHARRKFVDAEKSEPRIAAEAVALMNALFDVERRVKDLDAADRATARARESRPVVDALRGRLLAWKSQLLPKHAMSGAVGYALNQWEPLTAFLADPEVPIHNNLAEQEMKRQALNRKNSLFVGNEKGGETSAVLSSLTSSCRRHAVDPQIYLTQLLVNLPGTAAEELGAWLPDAWKTRQAERARAAETTGVG